MKRCHGVPALLAALTFSVAVPAWAAAPSDGGETPVELVVDTTSLEGLLAERLKLLLEEQLSEALYEDGFVVVPDGGVATIEARVEMTDVELRQYSIDLDLITDGEREGLGDAIACDACSEQRVADQAIELLPPLTGRLSEPPPEPPPELEPSGEQNPDLQHDPLGQMKLGPIGFSGGLTLVGGVAMGTAGVVMMSIPTRDGDYDFEPRAGGTAFVVVGSITAALGVAALVVDLTLLERQRRDRRMQVSVDLSPTSAGLWMSGRF